MAVNVEVDAYLFPMLHALKYSQYAVNGVLLGTSKQESVEIVQAIPLMHRDLCLSPMLDAAFALIDEHCKAKSLQIVGYYHANAQHNSNGISPTARRIADKINETMKERDAKARTCLMMIDNNEFEKLAAYLVGGTSAEMKKTFGLTIYTKADNGDWKSASDVNIKGFGDESTPARLLELVRAGKQNSVVDFENHVDHHEKRWLDAQIPA
ncbi:hypothetical protein GUITHDRAFT_154532 [Guillardia theta CCMP2712]|uniref:MPN domain-containing protein n=1 Tax=Guillardia theta (strain CCMP2712) TaxID=905079 RepID=L1ISB0_GUITC|nr:hypothetical protein GUITHDRAFT_154532 [Guillardia theta CCMP2712]EKX38982.1 hypothetical protein GUITHDRAFT_154532 [Guillardia theta CCMP2712]|eukprot:XP_005825962.1 hypothetical protein GUITHDRAFT_154532 [Guillardia theta CCMP2712]